MILFDKKRAEKALKVLKKYREGYYYEHQLGFTADDTVKDEKGTNGFWDLALDLIDEDCGLNIDGVDKLQDDLYFELKEIFLSRSRYKLITINGYWKDEPEQKIDGYLAAVGQYDGSFDDSNIFYWFDDFDQIIGDNLDFFVESWEKYEKAIFTTLD